LFPITLVMSALVMSALVMSALVMSALVMRKSGFISKGQSVSIPGTTGCVFRPAEGGQ
jgi:hypothetical protein